MSERDQFDKQGCAIMVLVMVLVLLIFNAIIDTWANYRDMHHLYNLQRRVGQLEEAIKR